MELASHLNRLTVIKPNTKASAEIELQQAKNSWKRASEEKDFSTARQSPLVRNASLEELKSALVYIIMKLGIRAINFPKEEEKALLIDHILKFFGGHTVNEIRLAFDLAIDGKLKVQVNCYENFSCMYFSTVMEAYREWAVCVHEYEQRNKSSTRLIEQKVSLTDQDKIQWLQETRSAVKGGIPMDLVPEPLYDFILGKGMISPSEEEKHNYLLRAIAYRQSQLQNLALEGNRNSRAELSQFMTMKSRGEFEVPEANRIRSIANKMILFDFLKK